MIILYWNTNLVYSEVFPVFTEIDFKWSLCVAIIFFQVAGGLWRDIWDCKRMVTATFLRGLCVWAPGVGFLQVRWIRIDKTVQVCQELPNVSLSVEISVSLQYWCKPLTTLLLILRVKHPFETSDLTFGRTSVSLRSRMCAIGSAAHIPLCKRYSVGFELLEHKQVNKEKQKIAEQKPVRRCGTFASVSKRTNVLFFLQLLCQHKIIAQPFITPAHTSRLPHSTRFGHISWTD